MFHQRYYMLLLTLFVLPFIGKCQNIASLDDALKAGKFDEVSAKVNAQVDGFIGKGNFDTLPDYIWYVGNVAVSRVKEDGAVKEVKAFIERVRKAGAPPRAMRFMDMYAAEFYSSIGRNATAYEVCEDALRITLSLPDATPGELGRVENNLATMGTRMGKSDLNKVHSRKALHYLESKSNTDYEALYVACNGFAAGLYTAYKLDSAIDYFGRAAAALKKADQNPLNKYYRAAILQNNLAGIYGVQGRVTEAIASMRSTISDLNSFMAVKDYHLKQKEAVLFKLEATDNLAGIYKDLGDYSKAQELLLHSYKEKQEKLNPGNPGLFISQILLGQLYFAMRQFDKSEQFLITGLDDLGKSDGDYLFWLADANYTLALLYDAEKKAEPAALHFSKADELYRESLQGDYDEVYLDFLQNEALFFSENGSGARGFAIAKNAYDYVMKNEKEESLMRFSHLLNLSEVSYNNNQYKQAGEYSIQGSHVLDQVMHTSKTLLDSIRMEIRQPKAILLESKAEYQLMAVKDVAGLTKLLDRLKAALALLERRKTIIQDPADISAMMSSQGDLINFVQKITLELYRLTKDPAYGEALIDLHESAMYNRIRARLDKNDSLRFSNVPLEVLKRERKVKDDITIALKNDRQDQLSAYINAVDNATRFQQQLKKEYPKYYQMRYQSIFRSLDSVFNALPSNVTLIRYFFVDKDLLAMAGDNKGKQLFTLEVHSLDSMISGITTGTLDVAATTSNLSLLYRQLWAPLASMVRHEKVVIIPDGILYNLNFELLTPVKINSFEELAKGTLLSRYAISYNYSLFLINQHQAITGITDNFIAFAPGFSDNIKQEYRRNSKDSLQLDNSYLSLLPQPFTVGLAGKTKDLLGGALYLNETSTAASFRAHAGEHRIIHIGTHAESNNLHPEFSRLIFAKDTEQQDDNSVYLYELYNCDLRSELTVLTACESGKPGYMDGEGMISLAHAFNYAGSQSMLTGLWKIDEQASAIIMESFYGNIKEGMDKDEALRKAKLTYLSKARGRTLAPVYWAGLVLMGDTEPIVFENRSGFAANAGWLIGGILLVIFSAILLRRKKRRKGATL